MQPMRNLRQGCANISERRDFKMSELRCPACGSKNLCKVGTEMIYCYSCEHKHSHGNYIYINLPSYNPDLDLEALEE